MNRWKRIFRGVVTAGLLAVVTASYGSFDRPVKVTHKENEEIKYYDTKFAEGCRKIFYNLRDGSLGLMRNTWEFVNGTAAGVGICTGKFLVLSGDVVGFVDDNLLTRHITRGIFSDTIEQASFYNFRIVKTMMLTTHEMDDLPIVIDREEYIDDNVIFKTRLYLRPWGIIVIPATLVGDGVIRPAASIAEFFSLRRFTDMEVKDIPTQLDEYGLQLIFNAYHMKLFFPIPDEEEPDLRIYTEEEVVGIRPPGPMLRPME